MVRPVGVGRSRPPLGVPIEINKSGAGFFDNPTPHIQTQAPKTALANYWKNRYNRSWRSNTVVWEERLPHRGVGNCSSPRPAFIYLGVPILHHALKSCKRFFILHADLSLFSAFSLFVVGALSAPGHGLITNNL